MRFAPTAFRESRSKTIADVEATLRATSNLTNIKPIILRHHPGILSALRMSTCPPLAVDRLIGLSSVPAGLVKTMEIEKRIPPKMNERECEAQLSKIAAIVEKLADPDIFVWLRRDPPATDSEVHRAATIVADRLCGSLANPIIRNAQERRQLEEIKHWLEGRGYHQVAEGTRFHKMLPGTFAFRMNVPVKLDGTEKTINIPIDAAVMPEHAQPGQLPLLFEAKSAGDFTNTNKRRKEEATKVAQLRRNYGADVRFNLFLCGYFNSGYLGYEAAEGIDWLWEHRIDDFLEFGI